MRYVDMFGEMAGKSNTLFMNQDMGELATVLGKGYAALDTLGEAGIMGKTKKGALGAGDSTVTSSSPGKVLGL